jgi:phosphohistidine phosphatase SixA
MEMFYLGKPMKYMKRAIQLLLILLSFGIGMFGFSYACAASSDLSEKLIDGQHILLIRHADAPGIGDPIGYKLNDCKTQRNLGEYGKNQSIQIGQWLKSKGVSEAQIFSSPWCRCKDTATGLQLGAVSIEPALGSFFDNMSLEKSQTLSLQNSIGKHLKAFPKKTLIYVTHHVNIEAFTGKVVSVGDMVLVKVNSTGKYLSHQIYPSPKAQ